MKRLVLLWVVFVSAVLQAQNEVHFRLIDDWAIVVDGTLAGKTHVTMLIDTGAVPSAIDSGLAKRMGFVGKQSEISVMNRTIAAERVRVPQAGVGPVSVEGLEMVVVDLGRISQGLRTRIDAVIGLDLLGKRNFSLDYRHRTIEFGGGNPGMEAVRFELGEEAGGTYIVIPVESEGQELKVLLDTGTKDLMLFQNHVPGMLNSLKARRNDSIMNAGGEDRVTEVQLPSVRMGPLTRKRQKAYMWAVSMDQERRFDGLLGPAALGVAVIRFDFARGVIEVGK